MPIRHKRTSTPGYVWAPNDLVAGQIGLNQADGTLHFNRDDGEVQTIKVVKNTSELTNDSGFLTDITSQPINSLANVNITGPASGHLLVYSPTGTWVNRSKENAGFSAVAMSGSYSDLANVPLNVSHFTNDTGYITAGGAPVQSVNGQTGNITFDSDDVQEGLTNHYFTQSRARDSISASGSLSYDVNTGVISYTQPTNVSSFTNDAGYLTSFTETDPVFSASAAAGITVGNISTWNSAVQPGSLASVATSGSYNDLTNTPVIPDSILDLGIADGTTGQVLTTNGAGAFSFTTVTGVTSNLDSLADVTITGPTTDQVLKYNGTNWVNATSPAGATDLNGLTDVVITSPTTDQVLKFNGTNWVNGTGGGGSNTFDNVVVNLTGVPAVSVKKTLGTTGTTPSILRSYMDTNSITGQASTHYTIETSLQNFTGSGDYYNSNSFGISHREPLWDSANNVWRSHNNELVRYGESGFYNVSADGGFVPAGKTWDFGVPVDFQRSGKVTYIGQDGGIGVWSLLNDAGGLVSKFIMQSDAPNNFVAVSDSAWQQLSWTAGQANPYQGYGVVWEVQFVYRMTEWNSSPTTVVSNVTPPNGLIADPWGGNLNCKFANTPNWFNPSTRELTMTRPASGTTFYVVTMEYFADFLMVKKWEEFTVV